MSSPNAIIAEDEAVLRDELRARLAELWPELSISAEAPDGLAAVRAFNEHAPDILFLDVQIPGMTGLEVARLASGKCHVVFVTAFDTHAVAAFEQGAVDYVMKPFSSARLAETVVRLKDRLRHQPAKLDGVLNQLGTRARQGDHLRWVTASQGNTLSVITVEQICYFRADNKYTMVVTADKEAVIRRPIKELAEAVDPNVFWQIHRSTLVNINAIAGVTRDFRGHLNVRLRQRTETLPVSESYAHLFKQM
ncbi:MAG: LytTR family DNA-binding domain-containing protein [Betaproteobacteria bacterium]